MVNNTLLTQQTIIASKKNTICAYQLCHNRKDGITVEIDGCGSIIPHVRGDALNFWHEAVEGQAASPMCSYETDIGESCQEGYDILQRDIAFTRIDMADRLATMRENK